MISSYYILWICVLLVVWGVLYKFWFITEWQNLRIKHRLVNDRLERAPGLRNKITGGSFYFLPHKLILLGYSLIFSSGITLFQMYILKNKPINSVDDVVQISSGILLNLALILGIRKANAKSDDDAWITRIAVFIREKMLLQIVLQERQDYLEFIHQQINRWHENDINDENTYFAGLIIRIHTEFFTEILNATTIEENESTAQLNKKLNLKDLPQKIIRDYHFGDETMTVLPRVKQLFAEYLAMADAEMFKVISFIKEHQQCCQGKTKTQLKNQIAVMVMPQKQKQSTIDSSKVFQKLALMLGQISEPGVDQGGLLTTIDNESDEKIQNP